MSGQAWQSTEVPNVGHLEKGNLWRMKKIEQALLHQGVRLWYLAALHVFPCFVVFGMCSCVATCTWLSPPSVGLFGTIIWRCRLAWIEISRCPCNYGKNNRKYYTWKIHWSTLSAGYTQCWVAQISTDQWKCEHIVSIASVGNRNSTWCLMSCTDHLSIESGCVKSAHLEWTPLPS